MQNHLCRRVKENLEDITRQKTRISNDIHPLREKAFQLFRFINHILIYDSNFHLQIFRTASLQYSQKQN